MRNALILLLWVVWCLPTLAQQAPRALIVIAHPDDETAFAATVYKITHELQGTVDLCVVTNGEGGYKYSLLAEPIYGLKLTEEAVGRQHLPRIRKQELMQAGKIIGINNFFFLDQKDAHYSTDEHEPLDTSWNVPLVQNRLREIMVNGKYGIVFCLLPTVETHGGHKAASLMALRVAQSLPEASRPAVLGAGVSSERDSVRHFTQLKQYAETATAADTAMFHFNRNQKFGYKNALSYQIVVNWEIAEHKSQGTMQLAMNQGAREDFWLFQCSPSNRVPYLNELFERLATRPGER
ncbi:MAG: PIG-L family deacetylase [Chitinophagales bacterium]